MKTYNLFLITILFMAIICSAVADEPPKQNIIDKLKETIGKLLGKKGEVKEAVEEAAEKIKDAVEEAAEKIQAVVEEETEEASGETEEEPAGEEL